VHQSAAESTDTCSVKTIAKTILVLLLTFGVLVGQTGIVTASASPVKPAVCKTCPCDSKMPTCCVEKSKPAPAKQAPAVPQVETRLIQPAVVFISELLTPARAAVGLEISALQRSTLRCLSDVPLFLRHRAILI